MTVVWIISRIICHVHAKLQILQPVLHQMFGLKSSQEAAGMGMIYHSKDLNDKEKELYKKSIFIFFPSFPILFILDLQFQTAGNSCVLHLTDFIFP